MLSANQISAFLNQPFLQNKLMKQPHFLHVDTNSQKLSFDWKFFGWAWSKMSAVNLVDGLFWGMELTVSEEWADGINWFFACWYKFMQIKRCLKIFGVGMVKNRCGQSGDGTLKWTVSKKWITHFLHVDTDWQKLKADQIFFGWT